MLHRVGDSAPWGKDVYRFRYSSDLYPGNNVPPRDIYIWFPPGYHENEDQHYPVLYMHDGQEIWDDSNSTPYGHGGWEINKIATKLILEGIIEPIIIVGISNLGKYRNEEYNPPMLDYKKYYPYANLIEVEIKSLIDRSFRTKPGREDTAIAGSSLGGWVSYWMIMSSPEVFGKAGLISPSFFRILNYFIRNQNEDPLLKEIKLYIDHDGWEDEPYSDGWLETKLMTQILDFEGYKLRGEQQQIIYKQFFVSKDIKPHNQKNWRKRVHVMLKTLFPKKP